MDFFCDCNFFLVESHATKRTVYSGAFATLARISSLHSVQHACIPHELELNFDRSCEKKSREKTEEQEKKERKKQGKLKKSMLEV